MRGAKGTAGTSGTAKMENKGRTAARAVTEKTAKRPGMSGSHTGKGHVMSHGTSRKGGTSK